SRTWPMLALTTNLEPKNLLIDLAFFGLSTITSDGPSPGAAAAADFRREVLPAAAFARGAAFGFAAFGLASPSVFDGVVVVGEDFRGTVVSYFLSSFHGAG